MKNIIKLFFLASVVAVGLSACKDDFLELRPSTSRNAAESITSLSDAEAALNGAYRRMTRLDYYGRRMVNYADMKGGDLGVTSRGIADDAMYLFTHEKDRDQYGAYWTTIYDVILQVNNIIINIDDGKVTTASPADAAKLNDFKAQALTIRAIAHYDLVKLYGYPYLKDNGASWGVPVVTTRLNPFDKPKRETVAQVYDQVIADLTTAVPLLSTAKKNGMINQFAAKALLARAYLYKGDYPNAYTTAKNIIESSPYVLYTPANWNASWNAQFSSESIFELLIIPDESDLGNSSLRSFYRPRNDVRTDLGAAAASDVFLNMFKNYPNDVRWARLGLDEFGNEKTPGREIPGRMGWIKKYEGDGKSPVSAVNIKLFRLSEIYFIAAEAAMKKSGKDAENAVKWLNDIRKRNPDAIPLTSGDADQTIIDEIMLERRKELIGEGHTYFDILRTGGTVTYDGPVFFGAPTVPSGGRPQTVNWNYFKCVLPISINELNVNDVIKAQQNPGYE